MPENVDIAVFYSVYRNAKTGSQSIVDLLPSARIMAATRIMLRSFFMGRSS